MSREDTVFHSHRLESISVESASLSIFLGELKKSCFCICEWVIWSIESEIEIWQGMNEPSNLVVEINVRTKYSLQQRLLFMLLGFDLEKSEFLQFCMIFSLLNYGLSE